MLWENDNKGSGRLPFHTQLFTDFTGSDYNTALYVRFFHRDIVYALTAFPHPLKPIGFTKSFRECNMAGFLLRFRAPIPLQQAMHEVAKPSPSRARGTQHIQ